MNNIFVISDTHFFHEQLSTVWGRPKDFGDRLEKGLSKLSEKDILIHLGDICIGRDKEAHDRYIKPLKCRKWLVRGNHDDKSGTWYLNNGWDFVSYKFQDKFYGKKVLFSHIPVLRDRGLIDLLYAAGDPDVNIHGHLHDTNHRLGENRGPYNKSFHKLVAVEYTDYKPVKLKTLIKEVCLEKKQRNYYHPMSKLKRIVQNLGK